MSKALLTVLVIFSIVTYAMAQPGAQITHRIKIDGQVVTAIITDDDTLYVAELDDVSITSKRKFASREEEALYRRYRRYATKVYPYAVKAIRVFRDVEEVTKEMSKRKQRRHLRKLQKELKKEFEDPLKSLSKTQGRILVHMIERELETPLHFLIKELKGGLTATYWSTAGSFFGYHLKRGYIQGEDPIMDIVLADFDVTHPK
ncbi:MAG: DUF4294 domain-containing protein [Saprospiraceae bacterium]|nr:DUF4294 domain-containing protein [Saprospiraceae bacterium]